MLLISLVRKRGWGFTSSPRAGSLHTHQILLLTSVKAELDLNRSIHNDIRELEMDEDNTRKETLKAK